MSLVDQIKYTAKTNNLGEAVFYVPNNKEYEIDVEQNEAMKKIKIPKLTYLEMGEVVFFEKTKMEEIVSGDTIVQNEITQTIGTSTHLLFTIHLKDLSGNSLANEPVYCDALNKKRVYKGVTNSNGDCTFMLEKGSEYTVNVKYERGLFLVEDVNSLGFATASVTRRYRGSAMIEKMIAEQKAEMIRMAEYEKQEKIKNEQIKAGTYVPQYRETSILMAEKPTNYLTKTTEGYDLNFKSSGPIGTPTVSGDKLFTKAGFYSPNFYCLEANSGNYIWGIQLGESGISPAVLHNGVLLINTESCTLYAVESLTGKLLWSKWLSSYLYSTPTAVENSVYVVYKHGDQPVLVCFDLKSGKCNWFRTVDNESIASPVVEGEEVHVASQSGTYYVFNRNTGKIILTNKTLNAVSSPTITSNKIYLTAIMDGKEKVVVLDRRTLKIEKKYTAELFSEKISGVANIDSKMNFNGSHPIVYQNKVVIVFDKMGIVAFDALSEKILWRKNVLTQSNQIPIIANNKVYVASSKGEMLNFDVFTGVSTTVSTGNKFDGQPIAKNGLLFVASSTVLSMKRSAQNFEFTQWNKDASHNLYWK